MKKRIYYQYGFSYDGWIGRIRKWYGWKTVIHFNSKESAYDWYYNK